MTNNNPDSGIPNPQTLKELMKTRRVDPGAKFEPCMGVNAIQISVGGTLKVGDAIVPLALGSHNRRGIWHGMAYPF